MPFAKCPKCGELARTADTFMRPGVALDFECRSYGGNKGAISFRQSNICKRLSVDAEWNWPQIAMGRWDHMKNQYGHIAKLEEWIKGECGCAGTLDRTPCAVCTFLRDAGDWRNDTEPTTFALQTDLEINKLNKKG